MFREMVLDGEHHVHVHDHVVFEYQTISNHIHHTSEGHKDPSFNVTHVVFVYRAQLFIVKSGIVGAVASYVYAHNHHVVRLLALSFTLNLIFISTNGFSHVI